MHKMESHYYWLEDNMEIVCKNYGVKYVNCLSAYGDKCSDVIQEAKNSNVPYYHACALYFLTYEHGIIKDSVRDSSGYYAKTDIAKWICEHYHEFENLFVGCGGHEDCFKEW